MKHALKLFGVSLALIAIVVFSLWWDGVLIECRRLYPRWFCLGEGFADEGSK